MRNVFTAAALALCTLVGSAARAQSKFDPAARAKIIAPLIDEQTLVVAHLDLTRAAVEPIVERLSDLRLVSPDEAAEIKAGAEPLRERLVGAGAKEIYAFYSLSGGLRDAKPFAAIPLDAAADEKAIRELLAGTGAVERKERLLLFAADHDGIMKIAAIVPDARPELTPALEAAGDTSAQILLLPPKHYRRVLEEAVGDVPKELGGGSITVFTRGILWAAVGIDPPPHAAIRLTIQSENAAAAEALRNKLADLIRLGSETEAVKKAVPNFGEVALPQLPRVANDRLVLALDEKTRGIDTIVAALAQPTEAIHRRAAMNQTTNNLKQIALALHNDYSALKHFPLPALADPHGKSLLSWRVAILPYLDQKGLYEQFHLDEPWDSPHNRPLIAKMPDVFRSPMTKNKEPGRTNYLLPVGNGAAFSADAPTTFKDITDGTSNTIMIVEADDEHAAIWTKPDDWQFDPQQPAKGLGSFYGGGFCTAFCDGSVRMLPGSIDPKSLRALFTRAGGEVVEGF